MTEDIVGRAGWLEHVYSDESLITQFDARDPDWSAPGPVSNTVPTSSSTLPSLVVRMLEDLDVNEGHRVLEIGTGTGYSTALLCHRLGADRVTSIETDPDVARHARDALATVGYRPRLLTGDGLLGDPEGAPYDRVIATCGLLTIPEVWVRQARPGGVALVTLRGWGWILGLARLTVDADGTAEGRFLDGGTSFMLARQQDAPTDLGMLPAPDEGEVRASEVGPDVLTDPAAAFVTTLAAPTARHVTMSLDSGPVSTFVLDHRTGSFAVLTAERPGQWSVRQGGPVRVWDSIERSLTHWRAAGAPPLEEFRIRVTPQEQTISLGIGANALSWTLAVS